MSFTDEQLVDRIQAGSKPAFAQLIDRYQGLVFTVCLRVLSNREEAEEAAQDVFLKLFQRARSFRKESRFSTWLYTLAYRTAIDHQRQASRHRKHQSEVQADQAAKNLTRPAEVEVKLHQEEQRLQVHRLLSKLPKQEALIVDLFYLQEQSVKEIAIILNISISNVKTKLFRSREKLRKLMQQQLSTDV